MYRKSCLTCEVLIKILDPEVGTPPLDREPRTILQTRWSRPFHGVYGHNGECCADFAEVKQKFEGF